MKSIFVLFVFAVLFYCGAFAQNVSDEMTSTESSGKSLDASAGSVGTMDTEVVPKADIPEAGVPASDYKGDETYSGGDNDLPPKGNTPADMKDLVTDDGTTPAGDYDKPSKGEPDSDLDSDLRQGSPKRPAVSDDLESGPSGSGADTPEPAKSQPSDNFGE